MAKTVTGDKTGVARPPKIDLEAALGRIYAQDRPVDFRSQGESNLESADSFGAFTPGEPKVQFLADGREVRLLEGVSYVGPDGVQWPVPAGEEVDGASIPRVFWTAVGGPFEGRYRNASIVHDHYCVTRARPWRETHRMFHDAMRCGGVRAVRAKVMYYAVFRFGPKWASGLESAIAESASASATFTDADAATIASDAEAISVHGLTLDEIERLAEARNAETHGGATGPLEGVEAANFEEPARARRLVILGGSGDAADLEAVAARASHLPDYAMSRFEREGVRIVACRESVTDFETDLRGVTPRGWERTGKTWDDVPGAYFPDRKRVVIATRAKGGAREVPDKSSLLHGSCDLLLHECFHGFDYIGDHGVLADPAFVAARDTDFAALGAYEQQAGRAGLEETFAESGARFIVEPAAMEGNWRALHGYWRTPPDEGLETARELPGPERADAPIGVARFGQGGAIELDLRAEGPGGAIGHAWLTVPPDDPSYSEMRSRLFGNEEGLETTAGQVLVYP